MSYRPYPDRERALKQLDRHYPPAPVAALSPALQSVGEGFQQIRAGLRQAAEQGFGTGAYVLSTRRDAGHLQITGDASSAVTIDSSAIRPWTPAEREGWYRGEGSPRPGVVSGGQ
ncbi:hypothetical protein [Streptomyces sp. AC555_RSS877]|uniref:hypothetical protein n=1 Tax=Streptomyces sp. AC555_RSS877 TaxID=2823688 RepID=UPI001C26A71C|nr:hypothetical protein [Streptomyces sp. AC555_RSS877]